MSEHFDELLSGVVESASSAAREPGAAAARKRGRQRRTRQRLASSALTVAVLGGAGGVAAVSLNHSGPGKVPVANSSVSASASVITASPSPSQSASESASPTAPTQNPTTTTPSDTNSGTPTSSIPSAVKTFWSAVPAGWLSPSLVPLDGTLHWAGGGVSTALSGVALMGQTPILYPCADAANGYPIFSKDVAGFSMNSFTATADVTGAGFDGTSGARQEYVRYSSVAAAQAAYAALVRDVGACSVLKDMTDVKNVPSTEVATKTATVSDGVAYTDIRRTDQGRPAQVNGNYTASDYHGYVVRSGNLLDIVFLDGGSPVDDSSHDSAALTTMIRALG
ncbi:hypothetical protein [Actinospica robiniae]|uniref:hypothetical protein n=1 Tax=Actinospica robiniae TaxID=304901 RepID=UPI0003F91D21|nr:hypothetical protein [Actinospica robiniae]